MTTRNKAAADAPPMDGQTAWTGSHQRDPIVTDEPPVLATAPQIAAAARLVGPNNGEQSNAGGKLAPTKKKHTMDLELQCMARIDRLLSEFDASGQARILAWVLSRNSKIELQHKVIQSDA